MLRPVSFGMLCLALGACSPEVELARHATSGGAAGMEPVGGSSSGGGGGGGSGGLSPEAGGGGVGEGGEPPSPPQPRLLADSIADFSLTQGDDGWYYGWDSGDVADFKLLGRIATITNFTPPSKDVWDCWASEAKRWTQIFRLGAHPNGTDTSPPGTAALERVVRRWVSDYEGDVLIRGEAAKIDLIDSNGVIALVYVDGVELRSITLAGDDGAGVAYEVEATLRVGSNVDFVVDPREGNDHHDLSRFTAVISRAATK